MADNSYDMKRKLLELQNELLKNSANNMHSTSPVSESVPQQVSMGDLDEIKVMLKELYSSQQMIMKTLLEIKDKSR